MAGIRAQGEQIAVRDLGDPVIRDFMRGGTETKSGAVVTPDGLMRVSVAWRCIGLISGAVANLPRDIIIRVDERHREPAVDHPVRNLLTRKPNHWQTPEEFIRQLQAHVLIRGNGYALKVKVGKRITALLPMHPDRVSVVQLPDLSLDYTYHRPNGAQIRLKADDVFHLRGLSLDGVTGLSVISYMREAVGLAIQAETAGARLFKHGVIAGQVYEHPDRMSPEAYGRLKQSIEEKYAGAENAHKAIILEEGMKASDKVAMTAADAEFIAVREFQRQDIATFYGVPPHMIGAGAGHNSNASPGMLQMSTLFVQYSLQDHLTMWQGAIRRDLLDGGDPRLEARFYTTGLLRGDPAARWETYKSGLDRGVYSPDEVRSYEDINPRPDGKGGEYTVASNLVGNRADNSKEKDQNVDPAAS
ncbi:phage portal protein [Kaistia terrae]|uniref:Phage portal protein n=1 Tax=Kaistia terrae TaxID=537017 RepID=A0ABW0Q444_9HYPH|nr:phage portal protein [Kaistia terrae]MCX5581333.1 phage portal protein [Kaistia terrae]